MSRIPRWLAPAALAPAAALDAAWALGINGPPAHVIAQTLALPAHAAALAALPAAALAPGRRARHLNAAAALAVLDKVSGPQPTAFAAQARPRARELADLSAKQLTLVDKECIQKRKALEQITVKVIATSEGK